MLNVGVQVQEPRTVLRATAQRVVCWTVHAVVCREEAFLRYVCGHVLLLVAHSTCVRAQAVCMYECVCTFVEDRLVSFLCAAEAAIGLWRAWVNAQ